MLMLRLESPSRWLKTPLYSQELMMTVEKYSKSVSTAMLITVTIKIQKTQTSMNKRDKRYNSMRKEWTSIMPRWSRSILWFLILKMLLLSMILQLIKLLEINWQMNFQTWICLLDNCLLGAVIKECKLLQISNISEVPKLPVYHQMMMQLVEVQCPQVLVLIMKELPLKWQRNRLQQLLERRLQLPLLELVQVVKLQVNNLSLKLTHLIQTSIRSLQIAQLWTWAKFLQWARCSSSLSTLKT